jgi:hypothetical protein
MKKAGCPTHTAEEDNTQNENDNVKSTFENSDDKVKVKSKEKEVMVTKKLLVVKEATLEDIIAELCEELETLSLHLLRADYQKEAFQTAIRLVKDKQLVSVQDFAENFRTMYAVEIQSAHFCYDQVSIFNQVSYYKCPQCEETVEESSVFLSDDLNHDTHFIKTCSSVYLQHLKKSGVDIEHEVIFSDGCTSQFKSKKPFLVVSNCEHEMQHEFFASGHGKNSCDGLGGMIKRSVAEHIAASEAIIKNAKDLYNYMDKHLSVQKVDTQCTHKLRTFFHVDKIERSDEGKDDLVRIPYTRQLHSLKKGNKPGEVLYRDLSCFCEGCERNDGSCINQYAGKAK